MELIVKNFNTKRGVVQACQLKWENSWLFIVDAPKGTITCGSFDLEALNSFGLPAAKVVPKLGKPAYSTEEFVDMRITHINELAANLGITIGMSVLEAVEKFY